MFFLLINAKYYKSVLYWFWDCAGLRGIVQYCAGLRGIARDCAEGKKRPARSPALNKQIN